MLLYVNVFLLFMLPWTVLAQADGCYVNDNTALCIFGDSIVAKFVNPGGLVTYSYFVGEGQVGKGTIRLKKSNFKYYEVQTDTPSSTGGIDITLLDHLNNPIEGISLEGMCKGKRIGGMTSKLGVVHIASNNCDSITNINTLDLTYGFPIFNILVGRSLTINTLYLSNGINNNEDPPRKKIRYNLSNSKLMIYDIILKDFREARRVFEVDSIDEAKLYIFSLYM